MHFGTDTMTPSFKILTNGKDITQTINKNTSKINIKDESENLADELTLEVQGSFKKPKYEDELEVWIGTLEDELFYCGTFKVQTSTQKIGNEASMSITATSADFSKNLKVKRNQSYEAVSVKTIVQTIGVTHNQKIVSNFEDVYVLHLEQTNESDMNFLTRIAKELNAVFVIKNDKIIFRKKIKNY